MLNVLIGRNHQFVPVLLSGVEQRSVLQVRPAKLECGIYNMAHEVPSERCRRALIEEDFHETVELAANASASSTASTWERSTPGNQERNSLMEAPSLKFSKSAATGTRVPRNTHAPLTVPGCCSTASQLFQYPTMGSLLTWVALIPASLIACSSNGKFCPIIRVRRLGRPESHMLGKSQFLPPVVAIPWMKTRWAQKKSTTIGSVKRVDAAISCDHSLPWTPRNCCSP